MCVCGGGRVQTTQARRGLGVRQEEHVYLPCFCAGGGGPSDSGAEAALLGRPQRMVARKGRPCSQALVDHGSTIYQLCDYGPS